MEDFELESALETGIEDHRKDLQLTESKSTTTVIDKTDDKDKKRDKVSLYNDTNISPRKIDSLKFKSVSTKSFAVAHNGSVPAEKVELFKKAAAVLFKNGYIYRSTDDDRNAIDKAIRDVPGARVKIYKPWSKFKGAESGFAIESDKTTRIAYEVACNTHKSFLKQKEIVRALYARETQVILGPECDIPINILLIYTPCGSTGFTKNFNMEKAGGTWYAMKVAIGANIPIANIGSDKFIQDFKDITSVISTTPPEPTEVKLATTTERPKETPKVEESKPQESILVQEYTDDLW